MNFVTDSDVNIYLENSEDKPNNPHRIVISPKMITPKITTPIVNISTTSEPQELATNVTKIQLQNSENKLFGKILAFRS